MSKDNITAVDIKHLIERIRITSDALFEFSSIYPVDSEPYNLIYVISEHLGEQVDKLYSTFKLLYDAELVNT